MAKVIAVGIKKLYYADPAKVTGDLTGTFWQPSLKMSARNRWRTSTKTHGASKRRSRLRRSTGINSPMAYIAKTPKWVTFRCRLPSGNTTMKPRRLSWAARGRRRHGNVREASRALKMHDRPDGRQPVLRLSEGLGYRP